jgi:hypothetical protein
MDPDVRRKLARCCVSLIMRTGGAERPFLHDRHFSDASSFQTGVSRGRLIASSGRLAQVLHHLHSISSQPSPPLRHCAIVGDGCAVALHPDWEMVLMRWGMPPPPLPLVGGLPFAAAADRELAL